MNEDNKKMPNEFPMMCPMSMGMNFCPMMMQYTPQCMYAHQHMGFPNSGLMMNNMNMMPNNYNPMMNNNMMPNNLNNPMMGTMPYSPQMNSNMMNNLNNINMKPVPMEEIRD